MWLHGGPPGRSSSQVDELGAGELDEPDWVRTIGNRLRDLSYRISDSLSMALKVRETVDGLYVITVGEEHEEIDGECGIDEHELNMLVQEVEQTSAAGGLTTFHGVEHGIDVQLDCPHDSEQYLETIGGMDDATDLPGYNSSQRGDIAEEEIGPQLVKDRQLTLNETFHEAEDDETGTLARRVRHRRTGFRWGVVHHRDEIPQ